MPPVGRASCTPGAIAAVKASVVPTGPSSTSETTIGVIAKWVADATGPGVIPVNDQATRSAALNRKNQSVIAGLTTAVDCGDEAEILAYLRILQSQQPALVSVGCC